MPNIARYLRCGFVGMKFAHPGIVGGLRVGVLTDMLADGTEIFGEPGMILIADFLVTEKQDQMVGEGAAQFAERLHPVTAA